MVDVSAGATAVTASSSSADWFNENLARVLGVQSLPSLSNLAVAAGGRPDPVAQRIAGLLKTRFRRGVGPTGHVTFETNGTPLLAMEGDLCNPMLAAQARIQLAAIRAALDAVDVNLCMPGGCPGEVASTLGPIRTTLDTLVDLAGRCDVRIETLMNLNALKDMLDSLWTLVNTAQLGSPSMEGENSLASVRGAQTTLRLFEATLEAYAVEDGGSVAELFEILGCCATRIPYYAEDVRQVLARAGITKCELARVVFTPSQQAPVAVGGTRLTKITLSEVLQAFVATPGRWQTLARQDPRGGIAVIQDGAVSLRSLLGVINPVTIVGKLALDGEAKNEVSRSVERFTHNAGGLLEKLAAWPPATGAQ
jgi:hypothetical protein